MEINMTTLKYKVALYMNKEASQASDYQEALQYYKINYPNSVAYGDLISGNRFRAGRVVQGFLRDKSRYRANSKLFTIGSPDVVNQQGNGYTNKGKNNVVFSKQKAGGDTSSDRLSSVYDIPPFGLLNKLRLDGRPYSNINNKLRLNSVKTIPTVQTQQISNPRSKRTSTPTVQTQQISNPRSKRTSTPRSKLNNRVLNSLHNRGYFRAGKHGVSFRGTKHGLINNINQERSVPNYRGNPRVATLLANLNRGLSLNGSLTNYYKGYSAGDPIFGAIGTSYRKMGRKLFNKYKAKTSPKQAESVPSTSTNSNDTNDSTISSTLTNKKVTTPKATKKTNIPHSQELSKNTNPFNSSVVNNGLLAKYVTMTPEDKAIFRKQHNKKVIYGMRKNRVSP